MQKIDPRHLLVRIIKALKRLHVPYLVTGGIAVMLWGRPRFTADIDIVIELRMRDLNQLEHELKQLSAGSYISGETMRKAIQTQGEFNFIDGVTGVKVDFWMFQNTAFDRSRFKRKVVKKILGEEVDFIACEDLILVKLLWYKKSFSNRELEDIGSILKISGKLLDTRYLQQWSTRLGVADIFKRVQE